MFTGQMSANNKDAHSLFRRAFNAAGGNKVIQYVDRKYMGYKKDKNLPEFINNNIKLTKVLSAIHKAIRSKDPSDLEPKLDDEDWIVEFKSRLLNILREDKQRKENDNRTNLDKYVTFLVNKKAGYICKCPDSAFHGYLYYSPVSKYIFLVNAEEIKFYMVYKDFPEKIFWLKENTKKAIEEFNAKQIKMYGKNARGWDGKPIPEAKDLKDTPHLEKDYKDPNAEHTEHLSKKHKDPNAEMTQHLNGVIKK